jgi:hypothetical protein
MARLDRLGGPALIRSRHTAKKVCVADDVGHAAVPSTAYRDSERPDGSRTRLRLAEALAAEPVAVVAAEVAAWVLEVEL